MVSWRSVALGLAGALGSGIAFHLGTGLEPVWWLTWLAPLPVLLVAPRVPLWTAASAGFVAWALGQLNVWTYFTGGLSQPPLLVAVLVVLTSMVFAGVVVAVRALLRAGRLVAGAAIVPVAWVTAEYLVSVLAPHGVFWSLAVSQFDAPLVLQIASVAGPWGVTFVVLTGASTIAAALAPGAASRRPVVLAGAAVLALSLGYGLVRLNATVETVGAPVAAVAVQQPADPVPVSTEEGRDLVARYVAEVEAIVGNGVQVVVLPEKAFRADETSLPVLSRPMTELATRRHVDIVVGLVLTRGGTTRNAALMFPADGGAPVEYDKHHLIPGLESEFAPGTTMTTGPWAIAICKDMDFPELVRQYRRDGARLMLVPAWDFGHDAWWHSRMAILRGVENGLPIVRAARNGAVTVSDPYGRVLAEARTLDQPTAVAIAAVPLPTGPTVYSRLGDWLAVLCLVLLGAGLVVVLGRRLRRRPLPEPAPPTAPAPMAAVIPSTKAIELAYDP